MSDEAKTPQAGEWWVWNEDGTIVYIVGTLQSDRRIAFEYRHGTVANVAVPYAMKYWHHEPRCNGFDWVAPVVVPDRFYVHADPQFKWYLCRVADDECRSVNRSSPEIQGESDFFQWSDLFQERLLTGDWLTVTEAEAKKRIQPEPAKPALRRVPVTLYADADVKKFITLQNVFAYAGPVTNPRFTEVKSDGNGGWFVEVDEEVGP